MTRNPSDVCPSLYQIGPPIVGSKSGKADRKSGPARPVSGTPRYQGINLGFHSGFVPSHSINMSTATPLPWPPTERESVKANFRAFFEHSPIPIALCALQGTVVEINPAFARRLNVQATGLRELRLAELIGAQDGNKSESLVRQLLDGERDGICFQESAKDGQSAINWAAWRVPGGAGEAEFAVLMAEPTAMHNSDVPSIEESLIQTQRWEAVGRLAGGVVHDFNNILTGVMLYCDLLLSTLDLHDRRRRYADEIRGAIVQASGLVQQLLVFARPRPTQARTLCLNQIAASMQDLLARLIGEHTVLDLHLDPQLGMVRIDPAQAQQILLNLVLNARDALPDGGRITVETSNCKFQPLGTSMLAQNREAFPCVLLVVADNGRGMDAKTRKRLFEPFFTTKSSGKGTGLGLTTVRSMVTTNRGLIHLESEVGRGTRVMILLPRISASADAELPDTAIASSSSPPAPTFQQIEKESIL
jgi:PAS domain S-box-containing protein